MTLQLSTDPTYRIRVNCSELTAEKSKGLWSRDVTVEVTNQTGIKICKNKQDVADVLEKSLAEAIWDAIEEVELVARQRGRTLLDMKKPGELFIEKTNLPQ
jgi:hypothetical protein